MGKELVFMSGFNLKDMPEENRWYYILGKVMSLPGVKVNREKFLREKFAKYYGENKVAEIIENGTGKADISLELIDKIAEKVINRHNGLATGASALAGIPGGFALLGTVPADIVQYYFHALQVAQKLAYIYGYPDLEQSSDEDFLAYLTFFIGVMSKVNTAAKGIQQLSNMLAINALKRLPRMALTKTAIYPLVKQIAKVLGVKMTKEIFAKSVAKIVPGLGALTSGGLTYFMFSREAGRLKKNLREDFILQQKIGDNKEKRK
jgi:hypothetical protein